MSTSDLLFIGIKGSVIALDRATGAQIWTTHLKSSDFVNVVFDAGRIYATTSGEVFCLEPLTGNAVWHNPLKGFGWGLATIAGEDDLRTSLRTVLAEKRRRDEATQTAATTTAAS